MKKFCENTPLMTTASRNSRNDLKTERSYGKGIDKNKKKFPPPRGGRMKVGVIEASNLEPQGVGGEPPS